MITLRNYLAQDGPIFHAPLVAFVVVAPVSFILFTVQGIVMAYEWIANRNPGNALLWVGLMGGLLAGLIPYLAAIAPYQSNSNYRALLAFGGLGTFQGLTVSVCHWVANKLKISEAR